MHVVTSIAVMARAKGGFRGEAGGRTAESSSTGDGDRAAVKFAARDRHVRLFECHHLIVEH